jgi:hypothetical protein
MDGQADSPGYLEYPDGMTIYAAVRGGVLYVATWSPGNGGGANDHFLFVTDALLASASGPAPWAKAGNVAVASNKPFIGAESATNYAGWFGAPSSSQVVKAAASSGQLEGTIDLVAAFGSLPQTIYVAAAAYQTADGGVLAAQGPAGNGDGNINPDEFMRLAVVAIKDENSDGIFDRLDPALDFVVSQLSETDGLRTVTWNSVPGRSYQLEYCEQLGGQWFALGQARIAGTGEIILSTEDAPGTRRFYRVRLLQ